ncbi:hypothetical protein DCO58_05535 [Helicobacter saguini]|uniref:Uncharacterized protein n=1 Tax=Helicobacter saguini TaxID=1548018 RepID=A0A347VT96_9HELI|nr:hypothetical protein [Helicobacter saguini]MWV62187.1 hypothetical protein [Helicobacter saguini]MWV67139.1 hypothetical protein [Helicobacter saguini]MWV69491.1 hypothetical protein [Helicobacter saguini]MWV70957.1 hypothetical protein [Helicobacter saguini]TLD92955.1 hypothetical protein LS64_009715 [Helicobacter saguini]
MKIPIYSNIKQYLESKKIDLSTSGQIAWFVCSIAVSFVIFVSLLLINIIENSNFNLLELVTFCIFLLFIVNNCYIKNILPFLMIITFIVLMIGFAKELKYMFWILSACLVLCICFVCAVAKKLGFFIVFCIDTIIAVCIYNLILISGGIPK